LEHDDVSYLKKILGELAMVLDQIEAELEKRKLENEGQKCELWLCGCAFTLADVLLGATLHRLKFLGLSKKYWEDGSRPNLQSFFERVQRRFAFRKVSRWNCGDWLGSEGTLPQDKANIKTQLL
ncbi:GDAP1L1 isoform 5, partial [Pongo abelii]